MSDEHEQGSDDEPETYEPPDLARFSAAPNPVADYYANWSANIGKIISDAIRPMYQVSLPRIQLPRYESPLASLGKQLADFSVFSNSVQSAMNTFARQQASQWQGLFESLAKLRRAQYPDNWIEGIDPTVADLETILIDEGIPLMWVPGPAVVRALLDAPDAATRRRLVGQRWKGIVSDCETVVQGIEHPRLKHDRKFALDCAEALRTGPPSAAQALAANLLDSIMRCYFKEADRTKLTSNRFTKNGVRFALDDYKFRVAMTFAPVWRAHANYRTGTGDPVPHTFGRHPSAHAVSPTQYSRINAVYGLMLVTSVLKFMDIHLPR